MLFGMSQAEPDQVPYDTFLSRLHTDDWEATQSAIKKFAASKGSYDVIHRVVWQDGSVHWLRCKGRFLNNSREAIGVSIDVTWLKHAQQQQEEIEEKLRKLNDELESRVKERTKELEQSSARLAMQAELLDLASDAIFVRGLDGRITYWNRGAERLYGWSREEAVGRTTSELLHTEFPVPVSEILSSESWQGELRQVKRDGTPVVVASRWTTLRDAASRPVAWLEIGTDISAQKVAEETARKLSSRILALQDEERRKIARELHDSFGQNLTALKMNLEALLGSAASGITAGRERVSECISLVEQCLSETRTLSHLLHPPLLDEAGLASAAMWYVEGFAKRSGLRVTCDIPKNLPRLRSNAELGLFRVLQESLTNVHRHSNCSAAQVHLQIHGEHIVLTVRDNGTGMSAERLQQIRETGAGVGIGLAGMRERLRDLGGELQFQSDASGTVVMATLPIAGGGTTGIEQPAIPACTPAA
jgi:PAS domain S-box-containing protein